MPRQAKTTTENLESLIGKTATIADGGILNGMSGRIRKANNYCGQPTVWIELVNVATLEKFLHPLPLKSASIE